MYIISIMKDNHRNTEFDTTKGIGMILMVMAHTYGPESLVWRIVYPFHMPLFYIVSGYFFKEKETLSIIKTSYTRLIKPYFFICITITFIRFIQHLTNPSIQFLDLYGSLNGLGPGWFLLSLFWCRILFNYIIRMTPKHYFFTSLIVSSIITLSYPFIPNKPSHIHLSLPQGLSCLIFIAIGFYSKQKKILNILSTHPYITITLSILFWLFSCIYGKVEISNCTYKLWIIDYLGAIGGTCLCYYIARWINNKNGITSTVFCYFSKYSIAILSFHAIDYTIFIWYHLEGLIDKEYMLTYIALGRILIIFLSIILTRRIPFLYHLFVRK